MNRHLGQALLFALVLAAAPARGEDGESEPALVTIGTLPHLEPRASRRAGPKERVRLEKAIERLADVDSLDPAVFAVGGPAPVPAGALLLGPAFASPLHEFLRAGPTAVPRLLACLDDRTPTRSQIERTRNWGGIQFGGELSGNPANPSERRAMDHAKTGIGAGRPSLFQVYRLTVGDLCFGALGQIVGRDYQAVRNDPRKTYGLLIQSPSYDSGLARDLRDIWSSADPDQHLLRSLLRDYATVPVPGPTAEQALAETSVLQAEAAFRLLYYFPRESAPLIARRIRGLNFANRDDIDTALARDVKEGIRVADFLEAVAWCRDPVVVRALAEVERQAIDPNILNAIARGRRRSPSP
jgi:hypothetical protein